MTTFDDRQRAEEGRFGREQDLAFRIRSRRNRLFGRWIAREQLRLPEAEQDGYSRALAAAGLDRSGDAAMLAKAAADFAAQGVAGPDEAALARRLVELEAEARQQIMAE